MHKPYTTNEIIFMGIILLITGIYGICIGVLGITNSKMKIPGLHQFGIFISTLTIGKARTEQSEKDLDDPKKKMRIGIIFLFFGILFLGAGLIFIFGPQYVQN